MRGDVQEPDLRCGTPGTSGHVTTKSSIHDWGVLYKSGVYALKALCLTPGALSCVPLKELRVEQSTLTACEKSAEGIVVVGETSRDRCTEDLPRRRPERYERSAMQV